MRYSHDGLAEPMLYLSLSVAAPEYSGVLTATVFSSSSEEVLDSGLLLVDADDLFTILGGSPRVFGCVNCHRLLVFIRGGIRLGSSARAVSAPDGSGAESM